MSGSPNIAARLPERALAHPDRIAIVEYRGGRRRAVDFAALAARVAGRAAAMRAAGVGAGDRVLVFVPMSIELYVTLLATFHVGAVAVFVDAWADVGRLNAAVALARPRLFVGSARAQLLRLMSRPVRAIPVHWWAGRRRDGGDAGPPALVAPETPALVTFTTGSTGAPKAAQRTHGFLWAQHQALRSHLGTAAGDVDMPTLPVFVLNSIAAGATSVIPDFDPRRPAAIDPAAIHRQMLAERVDTVSGSPAFFARLAQWCRSTGQSIPVRALFTGGAPVHPPLAALLAETTAGSVGIVYGSTEAEPVAGIEAVAMLRAIGAEREPEHRGLCVGTPVPEISVRIVRAADEPIALGAAGWAEWELDPGETGEIVVAGRHVLPGYLNAPEAERMQKIRDGGTLWHRTGDAGWRDAEGRLWLMGRVSGRVRRAGRTWWSVPAEVAALTVPGVAHAAYIGVADAALGQRAVLCVEPVARARRDGLEAELRCALGTIPLDELRLLRRIPRDPRHASKTDTVRLRRMLGAR